MLPYPAEGAAGADALSTLSRVGGSCPAAGTAASPIPGCTPLKLFPLDRAGWSVVSRAGGPMTSDAELCVSQVACD